MWTQAEEGHMIGQIVMNCLYGLFGFIVAAALILEIMYRYAKHLQRKITRARRDEVAAARRACRPPGPPARRLPSVRRILGGS